MKTNNSLLFFSESIDFNFLKSHLDNNEHNTTYLSSIDEFVKTCTEQEFQLIIVDSTGKEGIDKQILTCLTSSKKIYTPVLIVVNKDDRDLMQQSARHQFDFIVFPFNPEELIIRINASIRRKETELVIHYNLKDYRNLFDNFPGGIIQTDEHGSFLRYNREIFKLLNMKEKDFYGVNFFQLCHPDDYLIKRQHLDRILRKEIEQVNYEVRLINNNGETSVCRLSVKSIWKDEQTFSSFIFAIEKLSS